MYDCTLPIVAAIGHETDVTVAELVADVRCSTPTQAAMKLVPECAALRQQLSYLAGRLSQDLRRQLTGARHRLNSCAGRAFFRRPQELTDQAQHQVAQLEKQLDRALPKRLRYEHERLARLEPQLAAAAPRRVQQTRQHLTQFEQQLQRALPQRLRYERQRLDSLARYLEGISPKRVLQRGYTYTLDADGQVIRQAADTTAGQVLTTVFADGRVHSRIEPHADGKPTPPAQTKPAKKSRGRANDSSAQQGNLF